MSSAGQPPRSARRPGPARGTRRAVGGVPEPVPEGGRRRAPVRGAGAGEAAQPVPETPDELEDGSRQERWLRSQRPPHWG